MLFILHSNKIETCQLSLVISTQEQKLPTRSSEYVCKVKKKIRIYKFIHFSIVFIVLITCKQLQPD